MNNTVTVQQVKDILSGSKIDISTHEQKTTIVIATLPCGFKIVESSSCVDVANYDVSIGAEACMKRIENKIWELEGYVLQKKMSGQL